MTELAAHAPMDALPFPEGVRAFRPGDEAAVLGAMLRAHERGEFDGMSRHTLEESAGRLAREPQLAAVAVEGDAVAGWVVPNHDDLTVDLPFRRRGHGRRLVEAGRLLARRAGEARLQVWVPRRPAPEAFARSVGLAYHSSLWRMRLAEDAPAVAPEFPADVVVRWLEPGIDEQAVVPLVNDTFADHPSPVRLTVAEMQAVHARPGFDPSTILLVAPADDRDRLIGFCRLGAYEDDDGALVGEIKLVGVRQEARGRGLGRELVRWGIAGLRERGCGRIRLSVEGENTGALRLYDTLGFRPEVEWPHWSVDAR